ncbi:helix-turn-helix transcriptional regulator [Streptomyces sp. NPDC046374]|uniref:response regulator transcription factor n=1 Tax=Streptomyces sp. NPDC046374 TaxID=3154917 RepID=UPI003406E28C
MKLTRRRLQILRLMANGYGDQEIADRLSLSIHTVRDHYRYGIKRELGARNREHAVAIGFAAGVLSIKDLHLP